MATTYTTTTNWAAGGAAGFSVSVTFNFGANNFRTILLRTLGLGPDATLQEARAAYRKLAKEHHPDLGGDPEEFRRIQAAWQQLREM